MEFTAKYELDGSVTAGPFEDGNVWGGLTPTSDQWAIVAAWCDQGNTIAPAIVPVPDSISRRQFYQELANRGMITKEEALAAIVSNTLPTEFAAMVDAILDEDIQWQARMLLAGATEFERSNWFVDFFAAMRALPSEYMDGFWRAGVLLD